MGLPSVKGGAIGAYRVNHCSAVTPSIQPDGMGFQIVFLPTEVRKKRPDQSLTIEKIFEFRIFSLSPKK